MTAKPDKAKGEGWVSEKRGRESGERFKVIEQEKA